MSSDGNCFPKAYHISRGVRDRGARTSSSARCDSIWGTCVQHRSHMQAGRLFKNRLLRLAEPWDEPAPGRVVSLVGDPSVVCGEGSKNLVGGLGPHVEAGIAVQAVDPCAYVALEGLDGAVDAAEVPRRLGHLDTGMCEPRESGARWEVTIQNGNRRSSSVMPSHWLTPPGRR